MVASPVAGPAPASSTDLRLPRGGEELGDLDRVEGGALAQVVAGAEQSEAPPALDGLVGSDPPDVGGIPP